MGKNKKPANYYLRYFAILFLFFTVALFIGSFIFKNTTTTQYKCFLIILISEFLITYGVHVLTTYASERTVQFFGRLYMVISFLKILLYILVLLGLIMTYKEFMISTVFTFFAIYFAFRIFDLFVLFKFFKEKK